MLTLEKMLDGVSEKVREQIEKEIAEAVARAKSDLAFLVAEEFGRVGLRNADLGPLKGLIEDAALSAAKIVVGLLGVEYAHRASEASDNMIRGTLAGVALGAQEEEEEEERASR